MSWEGKLACIIFLSSKEAGRSFKEMIKSLGKKAMTKTKEKTAETVDTSSQKDARDIQALGTHAENVVLVFEKTISEIEREDYESQEKLLAGYKKLLEEQMLADGVNTNDICFELLSAALIENDSSLKDPVEFPRSPVEGTRCQHMNFILYAKPMCIFNPHPNMVLVRRLTNIIFPLKEIYKTIK
jgi:hypothetical protein